MGRIDSAALEAKLVECRLANRAKPRFVVVSEARQYGTSTAPFFPSFRMFRRVHPVLWWPRRPLATL